MLNLDAAARPSIDDLLAILSPSVPAEKAKPLKAVQEKVVVKPVAVAAVCCAEVIASLERCARDTHRTAA
jgi:hypothetical protein